MQKADKNIHESSPAYSLGVKYKEPKPEDLPGKDNFQYFSKNYTRDVTKIPIYLSNY